MSRLSRGSWQMIVSPSRVRRTSNSKPSAPCPSARSKATNVFSGAYLRAPRCPSNKRSVDKTDQLVELKVAKPGTFVRSLFGLLYGFLEFLFQQVLLVLLRVNRLAEDGLFAAFLIAHGLGRSIKVGEGLRLIGATWEMTARVNGSTFSTAPQHG